MKPTNATEAKKGKYIAISVSIFIGLWLLIEVPSISSWSATPTQWL